MKAPTKLLPVATIVDVKDTIDAFAASYEATKQAARARAVEIARELTAGGKADVAEAAALVGLETVKTLAENLAARAVLEPLRGRDTALEAQRREVDARALEADRARAVLERVAQLRWASLARRSNDLARAVRLAGEAASGVSEIDERLAAFVASGTMPEPRLESTRSAKAATALVGNLGDLAKAPEIMPSHADELWRPFVAELNAAIRRDPAPPSRKPGA